MIMGCAMPEAEQGMNVARGCDSRRLAGRDQRDDDQSFCSSGLQSIAMAIGSRAVARK